MTDWVKACSTDSIGQGEMFSFDYNEKKLLNSDWWCRFHWIFVNIETFKRD